MKYTLNVNQEMAVKLGLTLVQAHIFDFLTGAATWATAEQKDGKVYYWCSRQIICRELPLLKIKPDTVYRHFKALNDLGLIEYEKNGKKDLIRITKKGKSYYVGNKSEKPMSEINPNHYVGNKSEKTRKNFRKNSDLNPTDQYIKDHTIRRSEREDARAQEAETDLDTDKQKNLTEVIPFKTQSKPLTAINPDYQPSPETIANLKRNGLEPLSESELMEFVAYYEGKGELRANWDAAYRKWVVTQRRVYDKATQPVAGGTTSKARELFLQGGES